jgi:hypothetical protein
VSTLNEVTLSTTDQLLVSNAAWKCLNTEFDYSIPAEKASKVLLGKPAGTYTQTVTYTATAL